MTKRAARWGVVGGTRMGACGGNAPPTSKESLRQALTELIEADLATRMRAHRAASEAATDPEAKPENDKDTRALEQSYLARGEAARVEELRAALVEVRSMPVRALLPNEPIGVGALVSVQEAGVTQEIWLAPHGGGARLGAGSIQVVTPKSPVGKVLVGRHVGDECELALAGRSRVLVIMSAR